MKRSERWLQRQREKTEKRRQTLEYIARLEKETYLTPENMTRKISKMTRKRFARH